MNEETDNLGGEVREGKLFCPVPGFLGRSTFAERSCQLQSVCFPFDCCGWNAMETTGTWKRGKRDPITEQANLTSVFS